MRKYWALGRMVFVNQIEYPAEVVYWLFISLIPLFIMLFVWQAIFQSQSSVAGFSLSDIVTYYFLAFLINRFTAHPGFWIADMVQSGEVSTYLLMPFNFLKYIISHSLYRRCINTLISLPVILIILYSIRNLIIVPDTAMTVLLFLLSLVPAILLFYLLGVVVGLVAFWTLELGSMLYFYYFLLGFLGGTTIPLTLFPSWVRSISQFLPFQYIFYFPISIFLGRVDLNTFIVGFTISILWSGFLILIINYIWGMAVKKYSGFGN